MGGSKVPRRYRKQHASGLLIIHVLVYAHVFRPLRRRPEGLELGWALLCSLSALTARAMTYTRSRRVGGAHVDYTVMSLFSCFHVIKAS
jgi:hypothetical protein